MIKASMPPALANRRNRSWGICLGVLALVLLSIAMVCAVVYSLLNFSTVGRQRELASYLEKKYNEQFVVPEPKYKNGGFAVEGTWSTDFAHPRSNPDLKFHVGCNSYGCSDQYVAALWSIQANGELQEIVSQVNKEFSDYKADNARAEIVLSGDLVDAVDKQSRYDEYKTNDNNFLFRLIIDAPTNYKKSSYIFRIIEKLRERGVTSIKIDTNKNYIAPNSTRCTLFLDKKEPRAIEDLETCLKTKE